MVQKIQILLCHRKEDFPLVKLEYLNLECNIFQIRLKPQAQRMTQDMATNYQIISLQIQMIVIY